MFKLSGRKKTNSTHQQQQQHHQQHQQQPSTSTSSSLGISLENNQTFSSSPAPSSTHFPPSIHHQAISNTINPSSINQKSRSRRNSLTNSKKPSSKLSTSTPAPRSSDQISFPTHFNHHARQIKHSITNSDFSTAANQQQPPPLPQTNGLSSSSSSSSISSSTNSSTYDPTSSSLSLSSLITPTNETIHRHQNQHPWPQSTQHDNTPTLSSTPTPANHLARIPPPSIGNDPQMDSFNHVNASSSSSSTTTTTTPAPSTNLNRQPQTRATLHSSAGLLDIGSDAPKQQKPIDPSIPIRPRASSYHTSPSADRLTLQQQQQQQHPLPPLPLPTKRPTSLFNTNNSSTTSVPALSQPSTPHHSLDSTASSSKSSKSKKTPRQKPRNPKNDSRSQSSTTTPNFGIAGALALSGVTLAPHSTPFNLSENMQSSTASVYNGPTPSSSRSPDEKDDRSVHTTDSRTYNLSCLDDQLGTGYAVASRKRNVDFHTIFKSIPEDDYLIEDYGCALQRDILVQGRLYISEQHLCFNANIFGWVTTLVIPFSDVVTVEKRMTALIIPNAIQVITTQSRHTFASFLSRDATFDLMNSIWNIARPPGTAPTHGLTLDVTMPPLDDFSDGTKVGSSHDSSSSALSHSSTPAPTTATPISKKIDHPPTQCDCSPEEHYKEIIWDATYPTSPEKLYNILFQSDFLKDFWVNEEHLTEIEVGDWTTSPEAKYPSRSVSYIRPVNAPVGPKTIKCLVSDEHRALDFDKYVSVLSTTKTPDAPAGGGFCVRTLTCITWGPNNSSRWLVTAAVEWTKVNRFLKSIIESSAISGQKAYQVGVDQALRKHIQLSQPVEMVNERVVGLDNATTGLKKQKAEVIRTTTITTAKQVDVSKGGASGPISQVITSSKPAALNIRLPTDISWSMLLSIVMVIILLLCNLLSFRPLPLPPPHPSVSHDHHLGADGRMKLSHDMAATVKEALHEYFRDHPLHHHPIPLHPLPSSSETTASVGSDPHSQHLPALPVQLSPTDEINQIEILLQSLETRIRNVRQSLVDHHSS